MKRDFDLIRLILLEIERTPTYGDSVDLQLDGYNDDQVTYHIALLSELGLVTGGKRVIGSPTWFGIRLTWDGHEFLDASRDNERWAKAKSIAGKLGSVTIAVLREILTELLKAQLPPLT